MRKRKKEPSWRRQENDCHRLSASRILLFILLLVAWAILTAMRNEGIISADNFAELIIALIVEFLKEFLKSLLL